MQPAHLRLAGGTHFSRKANSWSRPRKRWHDDPEFEALLCRLERGIATEFTQSISTSEWSARIEALEKETASNRAEIDLLKRQVAEFQEQAMGDLVCDPYVEWCESHAEELLQFPDSFVAIDLIEGIVVSDLSASDFEEKLRKIEPGRRKRLLTLHTSMYKPMSA